MKIAFSKEVQKRWKEKLNQYGILYIYAMSGFGKTVQVEEFASREYKEWVRFSASEQFMDDLKSYIEKMSGRVKSLVILDDLQWIQGKKQQDQILELLLWMQKNQKMMQCILLSRARIPEYLTVLKLTKQLVVEDFQSLILSDEMAEEIIRESGIIEKRPDLFPEPNLIQNYAFKVCFKETRGYAIALNAFLEQLKEPGMDFKSAYKLGLRDVYTYFDQHIYQVWDLKHREAMMYLSACDFFDMELAKLILGETAKQIVEEMYHIGSFFQKGAKNYLQIYPIFLAFLRKKLAQIPEKERSSIYERAGFYFEKYRNVKQALECYKQAGNFKRMLNLMCYLSENADGCEFAKSCYAYMKEFNQEYEERFPKLLAIKAMVYSYHMELEKSDYYLNILKQKAEEEKKSKVGKEALSNYVRTLIALPHGTAEKTFESLKFFPSFIRENGIQVENVIPTGNMPSMINGGLDLLPWAKNSKVIYPIMKFGSEAVLGKEAIGIADVSLGEHCYQLNQLTKSIASLTKGLSEANLKGSIRVQYAATGVMAKVFQAGEQWETAFEILQHILEGVKEESFGELIPNIHASIMEAYLLKGDSKQYEIWLSTNPADEHDEFYITERYRLFVKAKVYVAQGRNLEALYIIELLEKYTTLFGRTFFQIELQILRAIIYERTRDDWEKELLLAIKISESYRYVRIFADYGVALLPLWKQLMDEDKLLNYDKKYITTVQKEMKNMAAHYPEYLEISKKFGMLTKKEIEVLRLIACGMNNQQIAKGLNLSVATVKFHISNILKKLQVNNRTSAVFCAKKEGLL